MTEIHGFCDDAFAAVRDQFERNFDEGLEVGACVAITVDGEPVVDLWAGDADSSGRPWAADTICNVWSTTKTMSAIVLLMLADRGEIDLDDPVARHWPEFAVNGKESVLIRHVLAHTAGLPGWNPPIAVSDLFDQESVAANLAAQTPWWEPGTNAGYHAITQGHLEAEIVRRVTGRTLGRFFREEVAEPLGAEFHIGLPEALEPKVAEMFAGGGPLRVDWDDIAEDDVATRTLLSVPLAGDAPNDRAWRAAEIPAAGGTGNARGVARVHAAIANGGTLEGITLLSPETVDRIFEEQIEVPDLVLGAKMRYGIGFGLMNDQIPLGPNERSCFWGGWGGSLAVIDCDSRMSFAYVMNKMAPELLGDTRGGLLAVLATNTAAAL